MGPPWIGSYLPFFRKIWKTLGDVELQFPETSGYIPVDLPGKLRKLDHTGKLLRAVIQPGYSIKQSTAKSVLGGTWWVAWMGLCGLCSRKTKR